MDLKTFMQKVFQLRTTAHYIAKAAPVRFKHCREAAAEAEQFFKQLQNLPKWKKWIFNRLLRNEG